MTDRTYWCNPGFFRQHVYFAFVPDEASWNATMKRLRCFAPPPYPPLDMVACCSRFQQHGGAMVLLVTMTDQVDGYPAAERAGMLIHECVHIWQRAKEFVSEQEPGRELEAMIVEKIVGEIFTGYEATRKPLFVKPRAGSHAEERLNWMRGDGWAPPVWAGRHG